LGPPAPPNDPAVAAEKAKNAGFSFVPLDSWVYEALDRLNALGLVPSQVSGIRPWTRAECRRQMLEAQEELRMAGPAAADFLADATSLINALQQELERPDEAAPGVVIDSLYMRNGGIAGPALHDSDHFGTTWNNDFGRPFGRGWNSYEGFTARAEAGHFFGYVQGEYQHAPGTPAESLPVRQFVSTLDFIPLQAAQNEPATNRFRTIEAYAGVRLGNIEFSVGKQALWWGPTYDSPLSFSSNAEPTKNFKASMVSPAELPGILHYLGRLKVEFAIGKLGGQIYDWRPWFNAEKFSFKVTENLEFGFTRWSVFLGVGHPITLHNLISNLTSFSSTGTGAFPDRTDPGDRKGGFDFRYRLPGLRSWLTLYSDSYSDDDPSPLDAPRRAALNPGLLLARTPGLERLSFRIEAPLTNVLSDQVLEPLLNYWNGQYRQANTNYKNLLGNPVGRDGRAFEGWATYSFSPVEKLQMSYREVKVSNQLLPGGGTQSDGTLRWSFPISQGLKSEVFLQYERFWIPVLSGPQVNRSGWLQLTWEPKYKIRF
jgi:hypothetical protein